jgi:hypothetical protein
MAIKSNLQCPGRIVCIYTWSRNKVTSKRSVIIMFIIRCKLILVQGQYKLKFSWYCILCRFISANYQLYKNIMLQSVLQFSVKPTDSHAKILCFRQFWGLQLSQYILYVVIGNHILIRKCLVLFLFAQHKLLALLFVVFFSPPPGAKWQIKRIGRCKTAENTFLLTGMCNDAIPNTASKVSKH